MECKVTSRLELSDHWIVYATVEMGRVSKPEALTAVHHRKAANYLARSSRVSEQARDVQVLPIGIDTGWIALTYRRVRITPC